MTPDPVEPVLVDFETARKLLGNMSMSLLREEMAAGNIAAQRVGKTKIVFQVSELRRYAAERPAWEPSR